ncbi:hypothetical protein FJY84_02610 [Candidatus Bathyarchaeota archaeon]|nr:hypothetical protein [Candidatus Bathyarchaeota archaeon]
MSEIKNNYKLLMDIGEKYSKTTLIRIHDKNYSIMKISDAKSTIDPPELDVTIGIRNTIKDFENAFGTTFWKDGPENLELLISSGNGGGLHMVVAGITEMISGESAKRAALGAGAYLLDTLSIDDRRPPYILVENLRNTKPDIFLLAGGTDGGAISQVIEMAELIKNADVRPRFGEEYQLPIIYAGNIQVRNRVSSTFPEKNYAVQSVDNIRPEIERENLGPAREAIYDSYMQHVIVHSPGFDKLVKWVKKPIIPTQAAIGKILYSYALKRKINLLAVNVGGSTTDIYSVYRGLFNRSLNADLGITYGILNVLKKAGIKNIKKWLVNEVPEREIRNIVANLMLYQPSKLQDEQEQILNALIREAIKLGVEDHKKLASRLKGVKTGLSISEIFSQMQDSTYLDMSKTNVIIGMGSAFTTSENNGILTLIDALEPIGVTEFYKDSNSLISHAGMLLDVDQEIALKMLENDVLQYLGTCVTPLGKTSDAIAIYVKIILPDGKTVDEVIESNRITTLNLEDVL